MARRKPPILRVVLRTDDDGRALEISTTEQAEGPKKLPARVIHEPEDHNRAADSAAPVQKIGRNRVIEDWQPPLGAKGLALEIAVHDWARTAFYEMPDDPRQEALNKKVIDRLLAERAATGKATEGKCAKAEEEGARCRELAARIIKERPTWKKNAVVSKVEEELRKMGTPRGNSTIEKDIRPLFSKTVRF